MGGTQQKGRIKRVWGKHTLNYKPFMLLLYKEWAIFSLHLFLSNLFLVCPVSIWYVTIPSLVSEFEGMKPGKLV
jgi:hypothetical protein